MYLIFLFIEKQFKPTENSCLKWLAIYIRIEIAFYKIIGKNLRL